ncbi:MAG: DMT family transporter, partial [Mesosutterella sp.]|nr:DMT family transporter [Mesosutterella sp.]
VLCLALAMAGVALLVSKGRLSSLDFSVSGVAWGIVSAGFGAFCTLQPGSVIRRTGVRFAVGWAMALGGAADLLFTSPFAGGARWTWESAGLYAFIVIFGTVLAFGCYLKSTSYVPASVTSLLSSFEPLTAVILTVTLLGVPFSAPEAAGAAMVIANMVILALPRKGPGGPG